MSNHLETLSKQLAQDPFFLACVLTGFARSERMDDVALAAALRCTPETLTMLRLCRAPELDRFKEDIDAIVTRFNVDADVLVRAVRRGQAIVSLQTRQPEQTGGMLLAARDDERTEPEPGASS